MSEAIYLFLLKGSAVLACHESNMSIAMQVFWGICLRLFWKIHRHRIAGSSGRVLGSIIIYNNLLDLV